MARKIGVLAIDAPSDARPTRYVDKNIANCMVNHLIARRLAKNLIQLLAIHEVQLAQIAQQIKPVQIPQLLAPLEFYAPFTDLPQWLHRIYAEHYAKMPSL